MAGNADKATNRHGARQARSRAMCWSSVTIQR